MRPPLVLVTGFTPFPGAPVNPSEALVGGLRRATLSRRHGIRLETAILPTEYRVVAQLLPRLWRELRPDAVLHVGLHGRAGEVRVELRGKNHRSPLAPDAAGERPGQTAIEPGGPAIRRATLPGAFMVAALRRRGVPAAPSHDAGAYLCNYATYLSLGLAPEGALAGFLHVPWPAEERGRARRAPPGRPDRARLAVALETAIAAVALGLRLRQRRHARDG